MGFFGEGVFWRRGLSNKNPSKKPHGAQGFPGPTQGLTWASLGLDPGQPRPAQVSPGQKTDQKIVLWQIENQKGGRARSAKRARPLLGGGRRPPPLFAKKRFFDKFFGLG